VREPSRALSILHVLAPAPVGGLERVVQALAAGQARRGHAVAVAPILTGHDGPSRLSDLIDRVPFIAALSAAAPGVAILPVLVGGRGYRQERAAIAGLAAHPGGARPAADVVHTHGYRPDVVDALHARARGYPIVTTVHGFTGGGWRNRLYERLQRRAFRRFDAVVAVSAPMVEDLVRNGVARSRIHLVPNAYAAPGPPLARDAARAALGLSPDEFVIGWVGRISAEKGLDVLLDALARDRRSAVAVLGVGRERTALEARAQRAGIAAMVRWLGLVPDAGRLFRAFDVFVLSSRTEGTPIALFEAMDANVPIIATAVGGVPAVVSPAEAVLVPSEDPAALAAAIRGVRDDPTSAGRRAAAARERLRAVYGPERWVDRYDDVYRAIVRDAPGDAAAPPAPGGDVVSPDERTMNPR